MIPEKYKGISSVIGAVIIDLVLCSVYTWSNINSYFVSYLKYHDTPSIELVDGYFLMPIIAFVSNIATYFGPKIDSKIGIKKCLMLTLVMVTLSHIILLYTTKLSFFKLNTQLLFFFCFDFILSKNFTKLNPLGFSVFIVA